MESKHKAEGIDADTEGHSETTSSVRSRQPTEKGLQYNLQLKQKSFNDIYKRLTTKSNDINQLMADGADIEEVRNTYKHWMIEYEQLLKTFEEICSYLTEEEKQEFISTSYREKDILLKNVKTSVENWFALRKIQTEKTEPSDGVKASDSVSQARSSRRPRSSRHSGSNISSARLAEETKQAELEAKAAVLKKKHELDLAKFKLELQQEELVLETELAVSDARRKVLNKYEASHASYVSDDVTKDNKAALTVKSEGKSEVKSGVYLQSQINNKTEINKQQFTSDNNNQSNNTVLNPTAESFVPNSVINNNEVTGSWFSPMQDQQNNDHIVDSKPISRNNSQTDMVLSVVRHLSKPTPELKPFNGDPLEFKRFIRQFDAKIVMNTDNNNERMSYLEQFTVGEPNAIVSGYSYLNADSGYPAAMKELNDRYGDNNTLAAAFVKRALNWPQIKADSPKALDDFGIFLAECNHAIQNISALKVLEYPDNLKRLLGKLPYYYHDKWRGVIQTSREKGHEIKFSQFVEFVKSESRKANDPIFGKEALRPEQKELPKGKQKTQANRTKGTYVTSVTTTPTTQTTQVLPRKSAFTHPCVFCDNQDHSLEHCEKIKSIKYQDRIDFLKVKGFCYGCLRLGHNRKSCRNKATCEHCKGRHPSICHVDGGPPPLPSARDTKTNNKPPIDNKTCVSVSTATSQQGPNNVDCTMAIIPVAVKLKNGMKTVNTYAFMDPGSTATFCSEGLIKELGGTGKPMEITLETMGQRSKMKTSAVNGLEICDIELNNVIELPRVFTKDKMPVTNAHIPTSNDIRKWSHLNDIVIPDINGEIGLLIGNNVADAYAPLEVRTGVRGSPHATRSLLGWILWNVVRESSETTVNTVTVNRTAIIAVQEVEDLKRLDRQVQDAIRLDFPEHLIDDKKEPSQHDKLFVNKVNKTIKYENGQYCINLPFKSDHVTFPNNKLQAQQRLRGLKAKMMASSRYREDYKVFMQTIIDKGYAEVVPENELERSDGKVWYIPHHGVYHPKKPNKIRVVFDCSSTYQGACINDALLQGPDLTTNLISVLLRFRQEKVAIMGDIESMFYRVKVPTEDADCLRFLWWPSGDIHGELQTYRMTVHLFGAVSSPSCANMALKKTAEDNSHKFDPKVAETVNRQFYVDDYLASEDTEEKAAQLAKDVSDMCQRGGFKLTKWVSSSRKVIQSIPEDRRATDVQELNLDCENLPNERVLGVHWVTEEDKLGFNIQPREYLYTRRGILSVVSSVFDPLGLAAPFVLIGKLILQDCSRKHIGWDDNVDGENLKHWQKWVQELSLLSSLKIDRCYKAGLSTEMTLCQLHVFADASEKGYGVALYLRLTDDQNNTHVTLLMGKSRVAPLKKISIPRMELMAACMAVRLSRVIVRELDFTIDETTFWTDSIAVLRYVNNESTRFHTFVANRVAVIRDGSDVSQWMYVPSKLNVADLASRGAHLDKFLANETWFNGPKFLKDPKTKWPQQDEKVTNLWENDPEVKTTAATTTSQPTSIVSELVSRFSDWSRLKSVLGWVLFAISKFKDLVSRRNNVKQTSKEDLKRRLLTTCLPDVCLTQAEETLVKSVQKEHFLKEIEILTDSEQSARRNALPKSSPLRKLDPFVVNGILRVGGRLSRADIPFNARHPIILPKCPMSMLYLLHVHKTIGHLGRNSILNTARQKFWIIGAPSSIKKLMKGCLTCRRYQAQVGEQKMADLPLERLQPNQPPFSKVGCDYWGVIEVKRGRTILKRYGVVFTCLTTRAVHLEMATSLDTDSCICAIRRLISRRGPVQVIWSDNGTNLVGSERELREEISRWNQTKIHNYLQQRNIKWIFNPPLASHHGGVWERIIRIVRKVLHSLLRQQTRQLDDELLRTLFCEVESILNSRPITEVSNDYKDLDALTPNHLLLMRSGEEFPPGIFNSADNYANRRWRQVQYLSDIFWRRWTLEYLPLLQERQKWHRPRRNLEKDDLVLVVDITPRKSWCLGRVMDTTKDRQGYVRSATVKTKTTTLVRPVDKLCLLLEADIE